jgi:hypothetical protein
MEDVCDIQEIRHLHHTDDPDDAYLLDLADSAGANYLVTGDRQSVQHLQNPAFSCKLKLLKSNAGKNNVYSSSHAAPCREVEPHGPASLRRR